MRLAFAGTPDVAIPSLEALLADGHEIVAVITRPDAAAGRGRALTPSAVSQFAHDHALPVLAPQRLLEIDDQLRALNPECITVVAYGALIPEAMLTIPRYGWINLHFSLLPAWRGAAPVQHAIMAGDTQTGATTFRIDAGLDTGPIYRRMTCDVTSTDTSGSLLHDLSITGAQLLAETVAHLGDESPTPQSVSGISHAPKLSKNDARILWTQPASVIDRILRACTPEPGAWTVMGDDRVVLEPVDLRADVTALPPGELSLEGHTVLVGTATHAVALGRVKPAGKPWMDADAWMRGLRREMRFIDDHR